ncbi:MAG TPA: DUF192 domain-containing protein [Steroidobacteraceae bacterium]
MQARGWWTIAVLMAVVALLASSLPLRTARAQEPLEKFPRSVLDIHTRHGPEWFSIWIADTPQRAQQGLMYLEWLSTDQGMLFPEQSPRVVHMWMKNTLIPLDMLFIDAKGRIVYIRERTTPMSEAIIASPEPVKAVLELAGGNCAKLGIRTGDRVHYELFGTAPEGPVRR